MFNRSGNHGIVRIYPVSLGPESCADPESIVGLQTLLSGLFNETDGRFPVSLPEPLPPAQGA